MLIKRPVGTKNSVNYTVTYSPTSRRRGFFSLKTPVGTCINELSPQVLRFSLYNKPILLYTKVRWTALRHYLHQ